MPPRLGVRPDFEPQPVAVANGPYDCIEGTSVLLSRAGSSDGQGGDNYTCTWDPGDGTGLVEDLPSGTAGDLAHQYDIPGWIYGTLTITSTLTGKSRTVGFIVYVIGTTSVASVTVDPLVLSGMVGEEGILVGTAFDEDSRELIGREITWTTDAPTVVGLVRQSNTTILVRFLSAGTAVVTPACEGIEGPEVPVSVTAVPPTGDVEAVVVRPRSLSGTTGAAGVLQATVYADGTLAARRADLLTYLQGLNAGTMDRVVSGQFWDNPGMDHINAIATQTGELPALVMFDVGTDAGIDAALEWADAGGLVALFWGLPWAQSVITAPWSLTNLLPGGQDRTAWLALLDTIAARLQRLRDSEVAVLWMPFEQINAANWYWWNWTDGGATIAQFIDVWEDMHAYLMTTKGLADCLLWVYGADAGHASTADDWYPGTDTVDIVAMEYVGTDFAGEPLTAYQQLVALNKPLFLMLYAGS